MPALLVDALMVVAGLALLALGGDRFVVGALRLAVALSLSPVVVGVLVIGLGTSLPELVVSALAAAQGTQDLAIGNVVGSNTANLLLVLGMAGLVRGLVVGRRTRRRELPLMLAATALLAIVAADGVLSLGDALVLLLGAVVVAVLLGLGAHRDREAQRHRHGAGDAAASARPRALSALALAVVALVATLAGAQLLIEGAVGIAEAAGVSEVVIGVTLVAVGTSLPEIGTALAAARRGQIDLIIGNVLGSNLFNSLPVAGVAALIDTVPLAPSLGPSLLVMLAASGLTALLLQRGRMLRRWEAAGLLVAYAGAVTVAVAAG